MPLIICQFGVGLLGVLGGQIAGFGLQQLFRPRVPFRITPAQIGRAAQAARLSALVPERGTLATTTDPFTGGLVLFREDQRQLLEQLIFENAIRDVSRELRRDIVTPRTVLPAFSPQQLEAFQARLAAAPQRGAFGEFLVARGRPLTGVTSSPERMMMMDRPRLRSRREVRRFIGGGRRPPTPGAAGTFISQRTIL